MRAYSRKKSIYTRSRLRQRLKKQILNSVRYGKRGQWNARRSQLLAKEYRAAGGGYRNQGRKTKQRSPIQWTKQDWQTASGKPSLKTGERYLPKAVIDRLSPQACASLPHKSTGSQKISKLASVAVWIISRI